MTHDQEIENHPFFKKHFAGKSTKEYHAMPLPHGSVGFHKWTAHHGIGPTPVEHKIFHRYYPETNSHAVAITTGTEGKNILGRHIYHSGEGEGNSATEALDKAIHAYKNDHGFHLQENMDQFASNKRETNIKDFKDFVKTTYAGLMEMELSEMHSSRGVSILPASRALFNKNKVAPDESVSVWPHGVVHTFENLDSGKGHFHVAGYGYKSYYQPGDIVQFKHDQTFARMPAGKFVGAAIYHEGKLHHVEGEDHSKTKAPLHVFK